MFRPSLGWALTLGSVDGIPHDRDRGKALLEEASTQGSERATLALVNLLIRESAFAGLDFDSERAEKHFSALEAREPGAPIDQEFLDNLDEALAALEPLLEKPAFEPEDGLRMLLDFDEKYGIRNVDSALWIFSECANDTARSGRSSRQKLNSRECANSWLKRAEELSGRLDAAFLANARISHAYIDGPDSDSIPPGVAQIVVEASELNSASKADQNLIPWFKLQRAILAIEGSGLPKNADVAKQYAHSATFAEDPGTRAGALNLLLDLSEPGRPNAYFPDAMRAYGWALLLKQTQESVEWSEDERQLHATRLAAVERALSVEERLVVQRAVSQWMPGQDLRLPAPVESSEEEHAARSVSGTAFLISKEGFALTNAHVAKHCTSITDAYGVAAATVAVDEANDLAALRFGSYQEKPFARFEAGSKLPRVGDRIVVFGFPLSEVLASTGNLTAGEVSANAGIGNNSAMFQISAPIQPGSSGSPVLSMRGNVAGVISSTASTVRVANATGTLAQNLNFAINKDTVVGFLRSNGIPFEEASDGYFSGRDLDVAEIAERSREWTMKIECKHRPSGGIE